MKKVKYAIRCSTEWQARECNIKYESRMADMYWVTFYIKDVDDFASIMYCKKKWYTIITYEEAKSKGMLWTCKECNWTGIWSSDEWTNSYCNCEIGRIKNDTLNQVISKKKTTEPQQSEDVIEKILNWIAEAVWDHKSFRWIIYIDMKIIQKILQEHLSSKK